MTRTLHVVGLALVMALAVSAIGTGSAAAAEEFHSTSATTNIEATQTTTHVFKTTSDEVTCKTATFKGTLPSSTAASVTLTPTYSGCHVNAFGVVIEATVNFNGCDYKLYAAGTADLLCPAGKAVVITASGCTITVGEQKGLVGLTYTNNGSHIDIAANLGKIVSKHSGFTCGTGEDKIATYKGNTTATGRNTAGSLVSIWHG